MSCPFVQEFACTAGSQRVSHAVKHSPCVFAATAIAQAVIVLDSNNPTATAQAIASAASSGSAEAFAKAYAAGMHVLSFTSTAWNLFFCCSDVSGMGREVCLFPETCMNMTAVRYS